jgi:hypothetical protein
LLAVHYVVWHQSVTFVSSQHILHQSEVAVCL